MDPTRSNAQFSCLTLFAGRVTRIVLKEGYKSMHYHKAKATIAASVFSFVFLVSTAQSQFVGADYFSMNESSLPSIDYDGLWGHVIYSMETIHLPADIGLYNYEVKDCSGYLLMRHFFQKIGLHFSSSGHRYKTVLL